jgi:hypothetical protein
MKMTFKLSRMQEATVTIAVGAWRQVGDEPPILSASEVLKLAEDQKVPIQWVAESGGCLLGAVVDSDMV